MDSQWLRGSLIVLASIGLTACGSPATALRAAVTTPAATPSAASTPSPTPSAEATPIPTPEPTPTATPEPVAAAAPAPAPPPPPPASMTVRFGQLAPGSHPIHLHSICNGTQNFHITTIGAIAPDGAGGASVTLPTSDFGRGWCLVVYTDASLTRVLNYRPI
jgi:hypothetical protein